MGSLSAWATWFTADLHLGHSNIIDYSDRPFANVDAKDRALIDNWNEAVAEDDTVWVVGDAEYPTTCGGTGRRSGRTAWRNCPALMQRSLFPI